MQKLWKLSKHAQQACSTTPWSCFSAQNQSNSCMSHLTTYVQFSFLVTVTTMKRSHSASYSIETTTDLCSKSSQNWAWAKHQLLTLQTNNSKAHQPKTTAYTAVLFWRIHSFCLCRSLKISYLILSSQFKRRWRSIVIRTFTKITSLDLFTSLSKLLGFFQACAKISEIRSRIKRIWLRRSWNLWKNVK